MISSSSSSPRTMKAGRSRDRKKLRNTVSCGKMTRKQFQGHKHHFYYCFISRYVKRKRENLCRPLYQTKAKVLRQDEGGGQPGGAVFWGGQRNLGHNGIAAEIQEVVLINNLVAKTHHKDSFSCVFLFQCVWRFAEIQVLVHFQQQRFHLKLRKLSS